MQKIDTLFDVQYPSTLVFGHQRQVADGTIFVTSTGRNNGIAGRVAPIADAKLFPAGAITAPLKGTVMEAFLQPEPFYCAHQIAVLTPKAPMSDAELLFYVSCLRANRFRFSYGRQADRSFRSLVVPAVTEIPDWAKSAATNQIDGADEAFSKTATPAIKTANWRNFRYDDIFEIRKGYYNKKLPECEPSPEAIPFIGASENNNGVTSYHRAEDIAAYARNGELEPEPTTEKKLFPANGITVANNGASVGYAFFQAQQFTASHDVNPLYLLGRGMTLEIGMFLCSVIAMDRYRWSYGRKWRPSRMPQSIIRLPAHPDGKPDWEFMETYVRSLPFSKTILVQQ